VAAELQSDERSGKSNNFRWTRRRNLNIFIQERGERERERGRKRDLARSAARAMRGDSDEQEGDRRKWESKADRREGGKGREEDRASG